MYPAHLIVCGMYPQKHMSTQDAQLIQKIIHPELKKISDALLTLERTLLEYLKSLKYEVSFIKENHPNKETLERIIKDARDNPKAPPLTIELLNEELQKSFETYLIPTIRLLVDEKFKQLEQEILYIKQNHPNKESLERTVQNVRDSIVKTLTPTAPKAPPPFPTS